MAKLWAYTLYYTIGKLKYKCSKFILNCIQFTFLIEKMLFLLRSWIKTDKTKHSHTQKTNKKTPKKTTQLSETSGFCWEEKMQVAGFAEPRLTSVCRGSRGGAGPREQGPRGTPAAMPGLAGDALCGSLTGTKR